jgi:hypothetical protein
MRYLFEVDQNRGSAPLHALGKRLLNADRNDVDILEEVALSSDTFGEQVSLLKRAITLAPDSRRLYFDLGVSYGRSYIFFYGPMSDGERSLLAFKEFMSLRPRNVDSVSTMQAYVASVNRLSTYYRANGITDPQKLKLSVERVQDGLVRSK